MRSRCFFRHVLGVPHGERAVATLQGGLELGEGVGVDQLAELGRPSSSASRPGSSVERLPPGAPPAASRPRT